MREFNNKFNSLMKEFPSKRTHTEEVILNKYLCAFEAQFQVFLKDKSPKTLHKAQNFTSQIEENLTIYEFDDHPEVISLQQVVVDLEMDHDNLIENIDALEEKCAYTQTNMSNISWADVPHEQ